MPITREDKEQIVADLTDKLTEQAAVVFVDVEGLSIGDQSLLRAQLREQGIEMIVARKTLIDIAFDNAGINTSVSGIKKPLALVVGYDDVVGPAKTVHEFAKEHEKPEIVGGLIGDTVAAIEEIQTLAMLPGRDELHAKVVGSLSAPMQGFVGVLQGTIRSLLSVLQQKAVKG